MNREKKFWMGTWPYNCDICQKDLTKTVVFYDSRTQSGRWGLLCPACFRMYGTGIGTGYGQEYDSNTLEKIKG